MSAPPLYERYDPVTQRVTEVTSEEDGLVFLQTQNTTPIVESAKRIASNFDPHVRRDMTHVARIPLVVWQRLVRTGVAHDQKALNAWLDSRECRLFRCDDGRKL
jgi:hypothetical protein